MFELIKNVIREQKKTQYIKGLRKYAVLNSQTCYGNQFRAEIRRPKEGHTFLEIGNYNMIDAGFIFEKDSGYVKIGNRCLIAGTIISINEIIIGNDVIVAWDTLIYDHNSHSLNWRERKLDVQREYYDYCAYRNPLKSKNWKTVKSKPIVICDKVWIGTGCKILKGVTIGEGAVIAAGSVVVKDVEPWTIAGGNPAQMIKRLDKR